MFASLVAVVLPAQDLRPPRDALILHEGRFTLVASKMDERLARALLAAAAARDSYPDLPRSARAVLIALAVDQAQFDEWVGPGAPEWGDAIALPDLGRIVMRGRSLNRSPDDPRRVLRHELAHLALHDALGALPPRWFDEGYAAWTAGEWGRDEVLATNLALVLRGMPRLDALDGYFTGGKTRAEQGYALAQRAVADLAALDPERGLTLLFQYWRQTGAFDPAIRKAYGITADAFEARWRSNTRRRFGGLALFADVTVGALVLLVFIGPLWVIRRQRDKRRLEAMRAADAVQDAREAQEQESALAALLGDWGPGAPGAPKPPDDEPIH
jgi:hypothetical protein